MSSVLRKGTPWGGRNDFNHPKYISWGKEWSKMLDSFIHALHYLSLFFWILDFGFSILLHTPLNPPSPDHLHACVVYEVTYFGNTCFAFLSAYFTCLLVSCLRTQSARRHRRFSPPLKTFTYILSGGPGTWQYLINSERDTFLVYHIHRDTINPRNRAYLSPVL